MKHILVLQLAKNFNRILGKYFISTIISNQQQKLTSNANETINKNSYLFCFYLYVINKSKNQVTITPSFNGLKKCNLLSRYSFVAKTPEDTQPVYTEHKTIEGHDTSILLNSTSINVITYAFKN